MEQQSVSRRRFLRSAAVGVPVLVLLPRKLRALSGTSLAGDDTRDLSFVHLHTGEHLDVTYWVSGSYEPVSLEAIDHVLRDWRTGEEHEMDPALMDLLYELREKTGTSSPYEVICGYRSPATNEMLRQNSGGVAKRSLHMEGKAIDIRLPDVPLSTLRDAALALRRGGVGYYPESNFVHVDTGRFRTW